MAYTYKTEQFGMSGAIGSTFKNGVFVWSADMIQAFCEYDTDRKRAARIVRERIAVWKKLDRIRASADRPGNRQDGPLPNLTDIGDHPVPLHSFMRQIGPERESNR